MNTPVVSITISVYNMANKIHRALDSIKCQTYKNIEVIIVDNGSTDNLKEKIDEYVDSVDFVIKYFRKEFAGRQTGLNMAIKNATGQYILEWCADDELVPNAIENMIDTWMGIPESKRNNYWAVIYRCADQINGRMVGKVFPDDINKWSRRKQIRFVKHTETVKMICAEKLKRPEYKFPEPKEVYHVQESVVWKHLECDFDTYYTNNIARIYYIEDEGLSAKIRRKTRQNMNDICWYYRHITLNPEQSVSKIKKVKYAVYYHITTLNFKKKYPYFCVKTKGNLFLQIQLLLLKIPCIVLGIMLEKKWNINE